MESRRYELTNKLRNLLKRDEKWTGLFKVTLNTTFNMQNTSQDVGVWEFYWVGKKLECISYKEKFFYATDDLDRCLFIAHSKEIGIKERIEFFGATIGEIRSSSKWFFDDWILRSSFMIKVFDS